MTIVLLSPCRHGGWQIETIRASGQPSALRVDGDLEYARRQAKSIADSEPDEAHVIEEIELDWPLFV